MRRKSNWPEQLGAYLSLVKNRSFKWGVFDCVLFVNGAILAMTGEDVLTRAGIWRWRSKREAVKLVRSLGATLEEAAGAVLEAQGCARVPVGMAQRGDVVVSREYDALGVVSLRGTTAIYLRHDGVLEVPISSACAAWRV